MAEIKRLLSQQDLEAEGFVYEAFAQKPWIGEKLQELRDKHSPSYDHSIRVGFLVSEASDFLYLSRNQRENATMAGLIHDIGKLGIPVRLLEGTSPGLYPEEKLIIESHVRHGIEQIRGYSLVLTKIMAAHHEFQENPYPRKNKRVSDAKIRPFQALIALCDHVDALGSDRAYKKAWEPEKIEEFLRPLFGEDLSLLRFVIGTRLRII